MRKYLAVIVSLLMLWSCTNNEIKVLLSADKLGGFQPTVVLMHPTVNNIKTFIELTENNVFPLPDDANVLGVYHINGTYDYGLSKDFLEELGNGHFKLLGVEGELSPNNLYLENDCSNAFREIFSNSKGIIFFGGPDMPAATYGHPTNLLTTITDVNRHYVELSFLYHLLGGLQNEDYSPLLEERPNYPILGICLGMQSMNVATGGTMYQDIPTELYGLQTVEEVLAQEQNAQHKNYHSNFGVDDELTWGHFHQIKFEKRTFLDTLNNFVEEFPYVWSSHHQALNVLGKGIIPIAWSIDQKIVEAVRHCKYPHVLGVQFHPEVPSIYSAEAKIKRIPLETDHKSYIDLYPDQKGEDFHRAFWQMVSTWYN
ncbi:MAG: gamma-glutamyl-gamma-aminobutyrate hydrolase family protein [Bacteroidales bacterium]|jgi:putative glutamine amidotransferase|nr:gamma-glutamyl-gamma-aminobutyrate hydrolase family protein [Bacteroidales bacterium]MDD4384084.1 gamma-glutamyl-gamma-aminobutyrate hydrolase family protein [Bacteroidales bacterium]MDY0197225.1 gamma-glutamyl-gamma-aminobutyrate hydrolase family protein [Tenuifilaceae bacterium]